MGNPTQQCEERKGQPGLSKRKKTAIDVNSNARISRKFSDDDRKNLFDCYFFFFFFFFFGGGHPKKGKTASLHIARA